MPDLNPQELTDGDASLLIYRSGPDWDGRKTACLGTLRIPSAESGTALLEEAKTRLLGEGFGAILGPMEGDTWHSYRVVTESDGSAPFLMEPVSGPHDLATLKASGFTPISTYVSARAPTEKAIRERTVPLRDVEITSWDGTDPEAVFGEVHDLSLQAFARNKFYQPIDRASFLSLYLPTVPMMQKDLIFLARNGAGTLVGFLFAIPDLTQGPAPKTAILKTYAATKAGVGQAMADRFHATALDMGLTTTIHALMHEDNASLRRSGMLGGHVFRRYQLLGLRL